MKKIIFILLMGSFVLVSCNDFLSKSPDNRTSLDSPSAVAELLVSAYPEAGYHGFVEVMSDNAGDKGKGRNVIEEISNEYAYYWKDDATTSYDTPTNYWSDTYAAIAASNHALEAIELNGGGKEYDAQRGEAYLTRAYSHFMLANIFGMHYNPTTAASNLAVPFVNEPEKTVYKDYKRISVEEIYNLIETDMLEGMKYIKDESYVVPKYHFTKTAANAFASRFYLYKGDWDKVIEYSNKVLGTNPVEKLRDWTGKYMTYVLNEFWNQYTKAEESANILLARQYSNWSAGCVVFRYSLAEKKMDELFRAASNDDFRLCFVDKLTTAGGEDQQLGFLPKFPNRYENETENGGIPNTIAPLLTMEEVLLNRAEAYVMKKEYDNALVDVDFYNQKRIRGYNPGWRFDEKAINDLYEEISGPALSPFYAVEARQIPYLWYLLDIRRREFVHEGMRWFDVKRFDIEVVHNVFDGTPITLPKGDLRRAVQIPAQAIAVGLTANPR